MKFKSVRWVARIIPLLGTSTAIVDKVAVLSNKKRRRDEVRT